MNYGVYRRRPDPRQRRMPVVIMRLMIGEPPAPPPEDALEVYEVEMGSLYNTTPESIYGE